MKTRLATALSVAGVLSAGSAAALVNTQILDGGPVESSVSAAILPTTSITQDTPIVDVPIPELQLDTTTVPTSTAVFDPSSATAQPTAGLPESIAGQSPSAPSAAASMLTAFNVGDAGVVTVDVIGDRVVLVDAQPKAGWAVTEALEYSAENRIAAEFSSATVRVDFSATLVDGQIVPSVSSKSIGGTTSGATSGQTATSPGAYEDDEHDDDDEYETDEHDDEYETERDDD